MWCICDYTHTFTALAAGCINCYWFCNCDINIRWIRWLRMRREDWGSGWRVQLNWMTLEIHKLVSWKENIVRKVSSWYVLHVTVNCDVSLNVLLQLVCHAQRPMKIQLDMTNENPAGYDQWKSSLIWPMKIQLDMTNENPAGYNQWNPAVMYNYMYIYMKNQWTTKRQALMLCKVTHSLCRTCYSPIPRLSPGAGESLGMGLAFQPLPLYWGWHNIPSSQLAKWWCIS